MTSSEPQVLRTYSKRDGFQRRTYHEPPSLLSPILSQKKEENNDVDLQIHPPPTNKRSKEAKSKIKRSDTPAKRKGSKGTTRRPSNPRRGGYCPLRFVLLAPPKGSQISLSHLSDSGSVADTLHSRPSSFTAEDSW